jgi:TRAP transporter TAXI family solute receptor
MERRVRVLVFFMVAFFATSLFVPIVGGQEKLPQEVIIGTYSIGGILHAIGVAAAKVITDHTKIRAVVKPMAGAVAWYPYLEKGEMQLGVLNMWDAEKGYMGESVYERLSNKKGFSVRLVCVTIDSLVGLMVPKDSPIKTISDLYGKRVAGNFPTPSTQVQTEALLANGNIAWKDVIPVPVTSPPEGIKMVIQGRADCSGTIALGSPIIEELDAKKGARYLPMDPSPEAVERMRKLFPGRMVKVEPGPGRTGVQKNQYLWAFDFYLIAGEKVDEETIYTITKALWNHYKEFELVNKELSRWRPERFVSKEATIPYHPGAIKFYKEKGLWDHAMDSLQRSLIDKKKRKVSGS